MWTVEDSEQNIFACLDSNQNLNKQVWHKKNPDCHSQALIPIVLIGWGQVLQ